MPYGMYISAEGAQAQQQRLEVIANNMANMETVGFKRDVPIFQARFAQAIQQQSDYPHSGTQNDVGGGVKIIDVETDYVSTSLRQTDIPTDFTVNGDGFFQVQAPDGNTYLTRAGNFTLDGNGRLITQTGEMPVLDADGNEIIIDNTRRWELYPGGQIVQDGAWTAIGLAKPQSNGDLVKMGSNMFRSLAPVAPVPDGERDIRQGYLEQSGVNPTREMMAMIETSRAYEANTRMIQHQDNMISGLVNRLLSTRT
jgi:flagellar basal-body rod protein FlgF/flagellar basal-body rod protein FlgG